MKDNIIFFGVIVITCVMIIYGWYSVERQIKKNIDDMDL